MDKVLWFFDIGVIKRRDYFRMLGYCLVSLDKKIIDDKYFCSFCELLLREVM